MAETPIHSSDFFMSSPDCSTTRRLTCEIPTCFDTPADGLPTLLKTPDSEHKIAEGGLRLQGLYKASGEDSPLVTVVTVVFNGAGFLEKTIKSVIEQTYDNVEYIIVDGGSYDGTLDIIRRYEHAIDYWVSEPDRGIYDAMNKGIDLGCGNWVNFMNAGDCFFSDGVVSKIFEDSVVLKCVDIIYGDHEVIYPNKSKIVKAGKVANLWKESQFCHQSAFVALNHHKPNKFNLCRKIAADFEFFYKSNKSGSNMVYRPFVVSRVGAGGVSDTKRLSSIVERFRCIENNFFTVPYYFSVFTLELVKAAIKNVKAKS